MTLADFLRRYLEDRRKVCEEKARSLDLGRNVQYFTKNEENVDSSENASPKYFSNTLDKTPKKNKTIKKGKTTVIRWVKRPDGGGQVETTIKDGKGNEEKRVTYLEDGKKYTIITRTDPSGKKQVEQQVTDAVNWYNKFFKPSQPPSQEFWKNDVMPFDSKNEEEIINNLIKVFENDSFAGAFKNLWAPGENKDDEWFPEDFTPRNDVFNEEMQKFMEQFEIDARKLHKNKREFGDRSVDYDLNTQVDSAMKNFITTKSPSLFEQFAERAVVELPEEKTPFDKFIEPDEETQKKRLSIYKEREEFMKKLDNFFNQDASNEDKHVVYSDIAPSQDQDLAIFVPRLEPPMNFNDFGGIIAKHFGSNNANLRFSSTSKIKLPNGKIRTETVSRDEKGNMEKSVTYQAGNKTFNVVTVTSPSGEQIKRQKDMNFPRDELPNFKNQWDKQFQSDFSD